MVFGRLDGVLDDWHGLHGIALLAIQDKILAFACIGLRNRVVIKTHCFLLFE
jgi:hypothetical protein